MKLRQFFQSFRLFALLFGVCLVAPQTPAAHEISPQFRSQCRYLLETLNHDFRTIYRSSAVQKFLKQQGIGFGKRTLPGLVERNELVYQFFLSAIAGTSEQNPEFKAEQERELDRQLTLRGAPRLGFGYERLRRVSRNNLLRIVGDKIETYRTNLQSLSPPTREALEGLSLAFNHNSIRRVQSDERGHNAMPVFSAKKLLEMGFSEKSGRNTLRFNREVMESHGQVFFRVRLKTPGGEMHDGDFTYGNHRMGVDSRYASERGWISPFVMYPGELLDVAKLITTTSYSTDRGGFMDLSPLLPFLHNLDFTVEDLTTLYRVQITHELARLQVSEPATFRRDERTLQEGRAADLSVLAEFLVHKPLQLPQAWEFKIPLAAPTGTLVAD